MVSLLTLLNLLFLYIPIFQFFTTKDLWLTLQDVCLNCVLILSLVNATHCCLMLA